MSHDASSRAVGEVFAAGGFFPETPPDQRKIAPDGHQKSNYSGIKVCDVACMATQKTSQTQSLKKNHAIKSP